MTQLTSDQLQSLERVLKDSIARTRGEIAAALKSSGSDEHMSLANHMSEVDDQAVADLETSLEIAMIERDMQELRGSVRALERLHTPGYGICADCDEAIAYGRLLANPAVTRCVKCQSGLESHERRPASL